MKFISELLFVLQTRVCVCVYCSGWFVENGDKGWWVVRWLCISGWQKGAVGEWVASEDFSGQPIYTE